MSPSKSLSSRVGLCFLAAWIVIAFASNPAKAQFWQWDVSLDGLQEVPSNASPGTGSAVVRLFVNDMMVDVSGTFQDLLSPTRPGAGQRAHIHGPAAPGVNAGVIVGLTADGEVTSGDFFTSVDGINPSPVAVSQTVMDHMLDGLTYINIHTDQFTGGEIRGNLLNPTFIPEPSSAMLLAMGVGGFLLRRRRG